MQPMHGGALDQSVTMMTPCTCCRELTIQMNYLHMQAGEIERYNPDGTVVHKLVWPVYTYMHGYIIIRLNRRGAFTLIGVYISMCDT